MRRKVVIEDSLVYYWKRFYSHKIKAIGSKEIEKCPSHINKINSFDSAAALNGYFY